MFLLMFFVLFSCKKVAKVHENEIISNDTMLVTTPKVQKVMAPISALEKKLITAGLVNIQKLDATILVDLKYSSVDNFVGVDLYGNLEKAYLQPDVAKKLVKAQHLLQKIDSSKTLLVYDAVRPKSVQQKMWNTLKMPFQEKIKFLSNPKNHSIHNYGAAVDLTIANVNGIALDMGTPFDHIGELAHPIKEALLLKQGRITKQQIANRKLLRKVMRYAGFFNIQTEWWHFNSCRKPIAKQRYSLLE